ncbi:tRNA (N6-threonylcarbamoyladenosine(37)-N6)-methyltransferase TrmO [Desulfohalovibrio reitneri]|uniref:tRNA (N6-threonylcarbamoyladenosine(37)-N6)-methyltransferase TrmO n=1 Tax=Desulfohalovibrio reitneri TaxID=1307759 RepID=UPI0004A6ACDC|nr:tRNA (N6-threonylcarbamoyladenosine(37)-N6)-methyltransferase TrmO [Desulfohalovibrio reitneri]
MRFEPVAHVRSILADRARAPKQGREGAPDAVLEFEEKYLPALDGLKTGDEVWLLCHFHQADRDTLSVHPRGDPANPRTGVFNTRSPDRPNPIGLHKVTIRAMDGARLAVGPLEAVDGTPVLDVKPVIPGESGPSGDGRHPEDLLARAGRLGWRRGLFAGFNGNLSLRPEDEPEVMVVTASGAAKRSLQPSDFARVRLSDGAHLSGPAPSTEARAHQAVYNRRQEARAIVHTHPPHLLALDLAEGMAGLRALPLFEADMFCCKLAECPAIPPGGEDLARAVARSAGELGEGMGAVFMGRHGLLAFGPDPLSALALSEELEALAKIRLLSRAGGA